MKPKFEGNFLELIPKLKPEITWKADENGIVTLEQENKGIFNLVAQKIFKKPKISYIHLDEFGSFVWQLIDGVRDITTIGVLVKEHFADKAEPLYERLVKFLNILKSYNFINL